ncbi:C6 transcription factor [Penicillium chermesinum]|uniref:C6 transcription factor n=1 Tax=Penicillium chermesinum TaxID=63820 RepID=A0A9W9TNL2_9EURO|nr:C6 transcription factor [Penicillium chermesinum]KAJ5232882.1 C6 transcription factor [Penicillium chermesinum]KAJ6172535.1 C6 transcription factor [Penicillium chermesinum]
MRRVRSITAWGLFNLNIQISMKFQKIAQLPPPAFAVLGEDGRDYEWKPYPHSIHLTYPRQLARLPQVRQGLAELSCIMVKFQETLHSEGSLRGSASNAEAGCSIDSLPHELQRWLEQWPSASTIKKEKEIMPQLLVPRIQCLDLSMAILELLIERDQKGLAQQLQQTWHMQAEDMAQCLALHRSSYGLKHIPGQLGDVVISAALRVVFQQQDSDEAKHLFTELCRFGVALAQRFRPASQAIHKILVLVNGSATAFPGELKDILSGLETRDE